MLPAEADGPAELAERHEAIERSREALTTLKPQELRALTLLAEGYSYREIGELTGFSTTKVNRCVAEGRERFRRFLVRREGGARCKELAPLLSAFADDEAARPTSPACASTSAPAPLPRDPARLPCRPRAAAALAPVLPLPRGSIVERLHDAYAAVATRVGGGEPRTRPWPGSPRAAAAAGPGWRRSPRCSAVCAGTVGGCGGLRRDRGRPRTPDRGPESLDRTPRGEGLPPPSPPPGRGRRRPATVEYEPAPPTESAAGTEPDPQPHGIGSPGDHEAEARPRRTPPAEEVDLLRPPAGRSRSGRIHRTGPDRNDQPGIVGHVESSSAAPSASSSPSSSYPPGPQPESSARERPGRLALAFAAAASSSPRRCFPRPRSPPPTATTSPASDVEGGEGWRSVDSFGVEWDPNPPGSEPVRYTVTHADATPIPGFTVWSTPERRGVAAGSRKSPASTLSTPGTTPAPTGTRLVTGRSSAAAPLRQRAPATGSGRRPSLGRRRQQTFTAHVSTRRRRCRCPGSRATRSRSTKGPKAHRVPGRTAARRPSRSAGRGRRRRDRASSACPKESATSTRWRSPARGWRRARSARRGSASTALRPSSVSKACRRAGPRDRCGCGRSEPTRSPGCTRPASADPSPRSPSTAGRRSSPPETRSRRRSPARASTRSPITGVTRSATPGTAACRSRIRGRPRCGSTKPARACASPQATAGDPERIEATVADALSGPRPDRGLIELPPGRQSGRFRPLPTDAARPARRPLELRRLPPRRLRIPRGRLRRGGELGGLDDPAPGGAPLVLHDPVEAGSPARLRVRRPRRLVFQRARAPTGAAAATAPSSAPSPSARRPARSPAATAPLVGGRLVDAGGEPLAGQTVDVVETFARGSRNGTRTTPVTTDAAAASAPGWRRGRAAGERRVPGDAPPHPRQWARRCGCGSAPRSACGSRPRGRGSAARRSSSAVAYLHPEARIPARGLPVQLEFRLPGTAWTEFRTLQSDGSGRFPYPYSFSDDDSAGVRFLFRAFVPATGDWPFAPATSRPLAVTG